MLRSTIGTVVRATPIAVALLLSAAATPAPAAVIFDNINAATAAYAAVFQQWLATSFTVGANNETLSSVDVKIVNPFDPSGNFIVRLYSNSGSNLPDMLLETLSGSSNPSPAGIFSYTGSSPLSANTSYWVVMGVSSSNGGDYFPGIDLSVEVGTPGPIGFARSFDQGSSWTADGLNPLGSFSVRMNGQMAASGVPEPTVLTFAMIVAPLWFTGHRIRRQRARALMVDAPVCTC